MLCEEHKFQSNDLAYAVYDPDQDGCVLILLKETINTDSTETYDLTEALWNLASEVQKEHFNKDNPPISSTVSLLQSPAPHIKILFSFAKDLPTLRTGGIRSPFFPVVRSGIQKSKDIKIVVAFTQESGLLLIQPHVFEALKNGANIRLLTSNYLHITQAKGLFRLLDWTKQASASEWSGSLEVRIYKTDKISFHAKSWIFGAPLNRAYVGSSNLSYTALCTGIEWNLSCDRNASPQTYSELETAFLEQWNQSDPLEWEWVEQYAQEAEQSSLNLPPGETAQPSETPLEPTPIQKEALLALHQARQKGHQRALIILATGLGKTYLSAFDVHNYMTEQAQNAQHRLLFVVHRHEILEQAASSFRRIFSSGQFGFFAGNKSETEGQIIFASIQKIHRHLHLFPCDYFDYIIIDEVHHAAAQSYQKLLSHFEPSFLLGLTATPIRSDGMNISCLFHDHICFEANLAEGIERQLLAPFHYVGRIDPIDYQPIPWRNGRFSPKELEDALCSDKRMLLLEELWTEIPGTKTVVFCASIKHADHVALWLNKKNVNALSIHTGPTSASRSEGLNALREGDVDALCVVDLFNEGLDLPQMDRIIMLRPTTSSLLFLQQLGRGLRKAPQKSKLHVVDLVGNHHVFLNRVQALLSLNSTTPFEALLQDTAQSKIPSGCSIDLEVGIVELLQHFLPKNGSPSIRLYREYRLLHRARPTLNLLYKLGVLSSDLYTEIHPKSWFHFLNHEDDLSSEELVALQTEADWFVMLERTPMTKSYKMIALHVLIEAELRGGEEGLIKGMTLQRFRSCCWKLLQQDPILAADLDPNIDDWDRYWDRWLQSSWDKDGRWLIFDGNKVRAKITPPSDILPILAQMSLELVQYRLTKYRSSSQGHTFSFVCRVSRLRGRLALRLPSGKKRIHLPQGDVFVRLPSGKQWIFRLVQNACHVAHAHNQTKNALPELLTEWFGDLVGTSPQQVRFVHLYDGWRIEPIGGLAPSFQERFEVPYYRSENLNLYPNPPSLIRLPFLDEDDPLLFCMHADNESMSEEHAPIKIGDWLVFRKILSQDWSDLKNKVVLLKSPEENTVLRRIVLLEDGYALQTGQGELEALDKNHVPIATLKQIIQPLELIPAIKSKLPDEYLMEYLGLSEKPKLGINKIDGLCFFLEDPTNASSVDNIIIYPEDTIYHLVKDKTHWTIEPKLRHSALEQLKKN